MVFGKSAEIAGQYFKQGTRIAISGRIQTGSYTNRDGQKIYTTDVVVETQEFAQSKTETQLQNTQTPKSDDGFMNIPDDIDEELPFT